MTPRLALNAIESLLGEMPAVVERDKLVNYVTLKGLVDELRIHARARGIPIPPVHEKILQLLTAAQELAELRPEGLEAMQRGLGAIKALRSLIKWNHEQRQDALDQDTA